MTQAVQPKVISGLGTRETKDDARARPAVLSLDPKTFDRSLDCVHCGLCLPACPTYTENGLEADSPRGRIYLMKGLAEGRISDSESVLNHLDLCLDCRACETACPSGVQYHELIEATRAEFVDRHKRTMVDRLVDFIFYKVFPYPTRLRLVLLPARLAQKCGIWRLMVSTPLSRLLPASLEKMQQMLPSRGPLWETTLAERYPAQLPTHLSKSAPNGQSRTTVGVLSGCVGSVMFQHVNRQMIQLLQHAGCDVIVPREQVCCGAILHHGGRVQAAAELAIANLKAFGYGRSGSSPPDYIVTNIAGCGAMLRDYAHLLRDDPKWAAAAKAFENSVRDISEVLLERLPDQAPRAIHRTVTYHDACHLAHAQKVTAPPRQLLGSIPGLKVVPLAESDMCCGAAGTYNLAQPQMARSLAERKIRHITTSGAAVCVTGNVGCAMQIQSEGDRLRAKIEVVHPVTLLHEAYFGNSAADR